MAEKQKLSTYKNQAQEQKYWKSFVTGGIAGILAKSTIAPFERIKLLYVTRNVHFSYQLALQDVKFIYQNHGILNFFRGNAANAMRVFPFAAINFSTFDYLRNNYWKPFPNENKIQKMIVLFLCGSFAGMSATACTYPLEVLRTRLAMEKSNFEYKNVFAGIRKTFNTEGIASLYSGLSIGLLGVFTYHGFAFFYIQNIKQYLLDFDEQLAKKWYIDFTVGGAASFIGQAISYPIDIVRKRIQGQTFLYLQNQIQTKQNIPGLIRQIYQQEGIMGFYKGLSINLIKGPLATGTVWTVKNFLNRSIDKAYDY